ncbi:MAG: hypothetical protein NTY20_00985 [Candidatus Aenigmarchaeota archaeon]|nr:hypothetical protein [Candidatus Aenigmarchaeota archaeon]
MRKGFLHVVEIVIVGLMAFLVLLQFSYMPKQNIDWAGMKLSTQANDILFSLDKKGVDFFNSTELDRAISSFVSNNTIYSLRIRNVMKPKINVGCICSAAETTSLTNTLQTFEINGQSMSFSVTRIDPIAFSHEYDVIVINDSNLASYYDQIRQFLGADKGIVEFRHFANLGEIDNVQTNLFNLKWNSSLPNPNADPVGFRSNMSSESYYNIYKYFHNIPIYQENFTSSAANWNTQIGSWSVNSQNYLGDSGAGTEAVSFYNRQFQDTYSMRALFRFDTAPNVKMIVYRQDASNYVAVDYNDGSNTVTVWDNLTGTPNNRGSAGYALASGIWYDVRIMPQPDRTLKIYINGSQINLVSPQPVTIRQNSQIGLGVQNGQSRFDNVRVSFTEKHNFSQILQNEKVQPQDNNLQKSMLIQRSTQLPACVVNSNIVDDRGRTAWLAYADPAANQDISNMLRTLVVWAAGDENVIIKNEVRNVPVVTSLYKIYDQDMYQPVEIVLTMGNLYG